MRHAVNAIYCFGPAGLACEVGDAAPQPRVCQSIRALLDRMESYSSEAGEATRPPGDHGRPRPYSGVALTSVAAALALTPDTPLPKTPERAEVSERTP